MPYIADKDRQYLKPALDPLIAHIKEMVREDRTIERAPGFYNYIISIILKESMGGVSYTKVNAAIGVLNCALQEFYRRIGIPYEEEKIRENGDVF